MVDDVQSSLEQFATHLSDGVLLLNAEAQVLFANAAAVDLLQMNGTHHSGLPVWEVAPFLRNTAVESAVTAALQGGAPRSGGFFHAGRNAWLDVHITRMGASLALQFRPGTASGMLASGTAAEALQEVAAVERQEAEIAAVYRTAPIGLALFDPVEFRYLRLNDRQAEFFGMAPDQILGKTVTELAPIPGVREMFEQVARGEPIVNFPLEGELVGRPGEYRYWTVNYFPVWDREGRVQAISAASLEITPQKKAELALIQSEKLAAVGRLASSISHEINNPLEAVTNLLYLIQMQADLSQESREYVATAQSELARVSQIATQTLRFHRQSAKATEVSAEQLLAPVVSVFQGRLHNAEITLLTRWRTARGVMCFENEIRQVLSNLIGNAIDAMRTGGSLFVRASECRSPEGEASLCITVADTGHGMSTKTRSRIFEPFFTTKELQGTGLGLWISKEIVERHKGRLHLRSSQRETCHGTVFRLTLPF